MDERLNLRGFGDFTLDLGSELLTRGGERVALQPQPMKVLVALVSRAGEVVSRKELQQLVWGDGTFVDANQGLNWCISRIREVLGDAAEAPRFIETVPRKGYRFLAAAPVATPRPRRRWPAVAAAIVIALIGAAATRHVVRPPSVTVVVLPFDNFTGDARNAWAADAATEEVINRVGRVDPSRLKVIDRITAAKFKRTNECIIHIGEQLGADFVMEGSLQAGHTTAALYRVADNTQVWAVSATGKAPEQVAAKVVATFVR